MKLLSRAGLLRLRVGRGRLHAEALHRGRVTWSADATYDSATNLADAIARLAAEAPRSCRRLVVALERPPVQLRTLGGVPPVQPKELAALVAHQAGRYFRRNGASLVTDAAWVQDGTARVPRAAAVAESLVEAIAAGAQAAGLVLETIRPADDPAPLALLPTSQRGARARAARRRVRRLSLLAAAVWVGVAALFLARLVWERRTVERELAALQAPLAAVLAARRELRDAERAIQTVAAADRERGRSLALLGAIATALPDSGVVASLSWRSDGTGALTGSARRAADVVARLERADAVPGLRLEGAVVREAIGGRQWERFAIVFGERGRRP